MPEAVRRCGTSAIFAGLLAASLAQTASADERTYLWADGLFGSKGVLVLSQGWSCVSGDVMTPGACKVGDGTRIELVRRADDYSPEIVDALNAGRTFKTLTLETMDGYPPRGTALSVSGARIVGDSVDDKGVERISIAFASITDEGLFYDEGRPAAVSQVPVAVSAFTPRHGR